MPKLRVTKLFTFDMAHALEGYDGLCKHIHGHTYHLSISLLGEVKNEPGNPKDGFVMDFKELKELVKTNVLDVFDHSLVLNEKSDFLENKKPGFSDERIILTPFQPTCENLLLHFVSIIKNNLPLNIELVSVRLDETPTSYAEWLKSDQ